MKRNKKAFTLIELVSVLVILAILALIVTPLVLNIIRKTRTAADKRSIDAYGRSIELAIADYLLENGTFPTSIEELTIEYSGDRVVCSNSGINEDGTIYLTDCTVNNREITGYTYGRLGFSSEDYRAYSVGDIIEYNGIQYYVIESSTLSSETVTLLKSTPLTVDEVNEYGTGHINRYASAPWGDTSNQVKDRNGYGGIAYYTSETCGYVSGDILTSGCISLYAQSEIKYVVDAWKIAKAPQAIEARLITYDELQENLGYEDEQYCSVENCKAIKVKTENTPEWLYDDNYYSYWTMSADGDSMLEVWNVSSDGSLSSGSVYESYLTVRPVIVLSKSVLN